MMATPGILHHDDTWSPFLIQVYLLPQGEWWPFPLTAKYQQSIFYKGPRLKEIKEADTISSFKNQLHKLYKSEFLRDRKV